MEAPVESRTVLTLPSVLWLSDRKEMTRIVQGKCSQLHDEAVAIIPILYMSKLRLDHLPKAT